jgi:hypothetical protein
MRCSKALAKRDHPYRTPQGLAARRRSVRAARSATGQHAGLVRQTFQAFALVILFATATAAASGKLPREYLDEQTGATISVVREPLVFVHERSGAPGTGDYVTIAAASVDQSGDISYVLVTYCWSVGMARSTGGSLCADAPLVLQADDRRIEIASRKSSAREAGIGVPIHRPPFGAATPFVYTTDLSTLRLLAETHHLSLRLGGESAPLDYELFEDQLSALREFVRSATAAP